MIDFEAAVQGIARPVEVETVVLDPDEERKRKLFGHTINDDGTLRCVSPSQYKSHKRCPRMWYYDKVLKRPRKAPGKGAKLGTECHGRMEKFLKTGVDIRGPLERFGDEMIRPYLARAPFNGGDMLVEEPLLNPQLKTPGGVLISGFSDVTLPPDGRWDKWGGGAFVKDGTVIVIDHKFKKKLAQYADTSEQLAAGDPQAVIYPAWALTKWRDAKACEFRHHNHQTEGARLNLPVSITDDRATVFAKWAKLGKYIDEEMARTAQIKNVLDVPAAGDKDPSVCRAFGGCDFLAECPSSPHNRYMNSLAMGTYLPENIAPSRGAAEPPTQGYDLMGLLDEMMDAPPPASAPAATTTTTAPAASVKPAFPPLEASTCKTGGIYMIPGGPVGKFEGVLGDRAIFKGKDGGLLSCAPSDYVKDLNGDAETVRMFETVKAHKTLIVDLSTTPDAELRAKNGMPPLDTTPKIDPKAGIVPKDAPADTNPPKAPVTPAAPAQAASTPPAENAGKVEDKKPADAPPAEGEAPKKRGRPVGSTNKPKLAELIVLVNNSCPAAEDLTPYVQGLCDALAKKANVADVRLGEKGSDLAYGGWKAMLHVMAKTNPPPAGLYVVQRTELSEPVIEALSTVGVVSYGGGR